VSSVQSLYFFRFAGTSCSDMLASWRPMADNIENFMIHFSRDRQVFIRTTYFCHDHYAWNILVIHFVKIQKVKRWCHWKKVIRCCFHSRSKPILVPLPSTPWTIGQAAYTRGLVAAKNACSRQKAYSCIASLADKRTLTYLLRSLRLCPSQPIKLTLWTAHARACGHCTTECDA
jgi:hypothetical protein